MGNKTQNRGWQVLILHFTSRNKTWKYLELMLNTDLISDTTEWWNCKCKIANSLPGLKTHSCSALLPKYYSKLHNIRWCHLRGKIRNKYVTYSTRKWKLWNEELFLKELCNQKLNVHIRNLQQNMDSFYFHFHSLFQTTHFVFHSRLYAFVNVKGSVFISMR